MKQHIIVEQLKELSEKGKERLRKWWYKRSTDGDLIAGCPHTSRHEFGLCLEENIWYQDSEWGYPAGWYLPLLSVGQMIEYLDENNSWILGKTSTWHGGGYSLSIGKTPTDLTQTEFEKNIRQYQEKELCDALWEAVKEVLEKEGK